jgi:arylsulfatase A
VPNIVRWPGVTRPGTVTHRPTISLDFYPTALEATGIRRVPDQPPDGVSLLPLLRDPDADLKRDALYWHYPHYHHSRPSGAIRAGDWKAIEFFDTHAIELYNLKDDLGESKDLVVAQPEKVKELRDRLRAWRHAVNAQMPQRNPAYDPKRAGEWWNRARVEPTEAPGTYRPAAKP